jgi:hypothetical protein
MSQETIFCECGRHFYHYVSRQYVARLSSGLVVLKPHAWPACVQKLEAERLERAEETTCSDLPKLG